MNFVHKNVHCNVHKRRKKYKYFILDISMYSIYSMSMYMYSTCTWMDNRLYFLQFFWGLKND